MKIRYKKSAYFAQLKKPISKYKGKYNILDEFNYFDKIYNNPYRIEQRIFQEKQRQKAQQRKQFQEINNYLKTNYKNLFYSLTKILNVMKNSIINECATLTTDNFISNLIAYFGDENKDLILSLDFSTLDTSNKGTTAESFKMILANNETIAKQLDDICKAQDEKNRNEIAELKKLAKSGNLSDSQKLELFNKLFAK